MQQVEIRLIPWLNGILNTVIIVYDDILVIDETRWFFSYTIKTFDVHCKEIVHLDRFQSYGISYIICSDYAMSFKFWPYLRCVHFCIILHVALPWYKEITRSNATTDRSLMPRCLIVMSWMTYIITVGVHMEKPSSFPFAEPSSLCNVTDKKNIARTDAHGRSTHTLQWACAGTSLHEPQAEWRLVPVLVSWILCGSHTSIISYFYPMTLFNCTGEIPWPEDSAQNPLSSL